MAIKSGSTNNDTLVGTAREDTLSGLSGDDLLRGLGGNDLLNGGNGKDFLEGGSGSDGLYGESGFDTLSGGAEADNLFGGYGDDKLDGGSGNDLLDGGSGNDELYAISGNDDLFGGDGDDYLQGGTGDDSLDGGAGNDDLSGGDGGDNYLVGSAGDDSLVTYDGDDVLAGGTGNDYLVSFNGRDTLVGGEGNDQLYGGDDPDLLLGDIGSDSLEGDEGDDFLVGDSGSDRLTGGYGNDNLSGGSGNDTLSGVYTFLQENPGLGEVDIFMGGIGRDIFMLGDEDQIFYNDDLEPLSAGKNDFAHIVDFNLSKDQIQLGPGSYILEASSIAGIPGTAIFLDQDVDELIAVIDGVSGLSLASPYFSFASTPRLAFSHPTFNTGESGAPVALSVTVTRTGSGAEAVSATVTLTDGTATAADYQQNPIVVNFAAGDTTNKSVAIPLVEDTLAEGNEIINLSLGNPTGGALIGEQQRATLMIVDNDNYRITDLGNPLNDGDTINSEGQVIPDGKTFNNKGQSVSGQFLKNPNGSVQDLGTLPQYSTSDDPYTKAKAINNKGEVVGDSSGPFFWSENLGISPIGIGGPGSANDINDKSQVVGSSGTSSSGYDAFLYTPKLGNTFIPSIPDGDYTIPNGLNEKDQVVGLSYDADDNYTESAFLYKDGVSYNLNNLISPNSGWTLETAIDLSNNGQIIGNGTLSGETHGFLLTPIV